MNRRAFLSRFGTGTVVGLSGCSALQSSEENDSSKLDTKEPTESPSATPEPIYQLQASELQYDLTGLQTSVLDRHDRAYVKKNHAASPEITLLKNDEQASLERLSDLSLETEDGTQIELTETGHVPEYAVEDGQELAVRAEVNGEFIHDNIPVQKELPESFLVDAEIVEEGEILYQTPWNTPYQFDNHTTDRREFLQIRAEKRDTLAKDNVLERIDSESIEENWNTLRSRDYTERELKKFMLANVRASVVGTPTSESVLGIDEDNAIAQAINEEKIMRGLDFLPYNEVFIGALSNRGPGVSPPSPPRRASKVAYVDGDWYHVSSPSAEVEHVKNLDKINMVSNPAYDSYESTLAEFEKNPEWITPFDKTRLIDRSIQAPVTLNGALAGFATIFTTFSISWSALESMRNNTPWRDFMPQLEVGVDYAMRTTRNEDRNEDEIPERVTAAFGDDIGNLQLLNTTGRNVMTKEGKEAFFILVDWQDPERIKTEYLT